MKKEKNEATVKGMIELNRFQPYTKETVFNYELEIPDYLIEEINSLHEKQKFSFCLSEKNQTEKKYSVIEYLLI